MNSVHIVPGATPAQGVMAVVCGFIHTVSKHITRTSKVVHAQSFYCAYLIVETTDDLSHLQVRKSKSGVLRDIQAAQLCDIIQNPNLAVGA